MTDISNQSTFIVILFADDLVLYHFPTRRSSDLGNDLALLGAGDDVFVWNPGDGSDTVEGQDGLDSLQFNGANIARKDDQTAKLQSRQNIRCRLHIDNKINAF